MAIRDIEAFLRERAAIFDSNLDLNPGSPFDRQVIQPLVRRLGTDPFTVDLETFITSRLQQAYPELAIEEGDALVDLLVKPMQLLWEPIIREIDRVRKGLSFRDPNTLTEDEAEALGANLFAERTQGEFARGVGRLYFSQAQNISITPVNIVTSKGGLLFTPTETQSIRTEEMLLNANGDDTFYFDVNLIAEQPGTEYNINPGELSSIANLEAAVRVTNLRRFTFGEAPETAAEFVDATRQGLTEKSLVTLRGIASKVTKSIPEVTRLNVVGYNDPEMQRDIITGGGLGSLLSSGVAGSVINDDVGGALSSRFRTTEIDFTQIVGPINTPPTGFVLTVIGASAPDVGVDLTITKVVDTETVEVDSAELIVGRTDLVWTVRKRELTLSGIPGGIIFPDGPNGVVNIPDNQIHIGGTTDVHVRGAGFDESTIIIDGLSDDSPEASGVAFDFSTTSSGILTDLVLGSNYIVGDTTHVLLSRAARDGLSLQIVNGPNAGPYQILNVVQAAGLSPVVTTTPVFDTAVADDALWRIFDAINVTLTDIKDPRVAAGDLITVQNSDLVSTGGSTNFDVLGVSEGDTLRILEGADEGEYRIVEAPIAPGFTSLRLDQRLTVSQSSVPYEIFRGNASGNILTPFIRITSVELLDSSQQPLGTTVPYALPVDVQSKAFQNPARGVKHRIKDTVLGLVTLPQPGAGFDVGNRTLNLETPVGNVSFSFTAGNKTASEVQAELNAAIFAQTSPQEFDASIIVSDSLGDRVGIRPFGPGGLVRAVGGSALSFLFGSGPVFTTNDIRSSTAQAAGGWDNLVPVINLTSGLDVVEIVDGNHIGFVAGPFSASLPNVLTPLGLSNPFGPELQVTVEVGARSLGSARVYFLEPTSFEARANETFFSVVTNNGLVRFTPDPTLHHQTIPPLPSGTKPKDGASTNAASVFTSLTQDFVRAGVQAGDLVEIDYFPMAGTVSLSDPVSSLVDKSLIYSLNGGADQTLVFIRDDTSLAVDQVTRQGVVDQINASAGVAIVSLTADDRLEFDADMDIVIRSNGSANPIILGSVFGTAPLQSFAIDDQRNQSPLAGRYRILSVDSATQLTIEDAFTDSLSANKVPPYPATVSRQQFRVLRAGVQRISTGSMARNEAEAGLYYFDIELVSEGTGDEFNITSGLQLTAEGFRSDGYYLTTEDANLSFSPAERVGMVISKDILEEGVDDSPVNATRLANQNIQVTYDRSEMVDSVNNFISSEVERVVNSSPLGRHLVPSFVRFDATYTGGSKEEVVIPDLEAYIRGLSPVEALESSDIQKIISDRGATSIENPISLLAVVHNVDRSITLARSTNKLTTGRLTSFIPELLNVVRDIT